MSREQVRKRVVTERVSMRVLAALLGILCGCSTKFDPQSGRSAPAAGPMVQARQQEPYQNQTRALSFEAFQSGIQLQRPSAIKDKTLDANPQIVNETREVWFSGTGR